MTGGKKIFTGAGERTAVCGSWKCKNEQLQ
jgi:hypothetical protein